MIMPTAVTALIEESHSLEQRGEIGPALQRAQAALTLARALGETDAEAAALIGVATIHFRLGHYDEARVLADQALARTAPDSATSAHALLILGNCAAETYSFADAENFYQRAADLGRVNDDHVIRLRALHGLGQGVYMPRGQFDLALAADDEAYRLAQQHRWSDWLPYPLTTIAWIYQLTGQYERAHVALDALHQVIVPGSLHHGYHAYLTANLALAEGDDPAVPALYAQARSIAEAIGEPGLNVEVRLGLSRYQRSTGDAPGAQAWANDALIIAQRVGYQHQQGKSLIERGQARWSIGPVSAAEDDFRSAIEILTPLHADFDLARACLLLAAVRQSRRDTGARSLWLEAVARIISGGYGFLLEQERVMAFPLLAGYLNDDSLEVVNVSTTLLKHLGRVPPPPLQIITLGRFEVWRRRRLIDRRAWAQRRAGELFRLLLIAPDHSLSREQIIEALWPDKSPAQTQPLLHNATSALRRILEPDLPDKFPSRYLDVEEGRVALRLPIDSTIDFEVFEQHVCHEHWAAAVSINGGDLFPDDSYADWAAAPRERLSQLRLRVLSIQAQLELNAGHPAVALDLCRQALSIEPWHEPVVLIAMRASLALNDRPNAIRLYRSLAHTLETEFGLTPLLELRDLYTAIGAA